MTNLPFELISILNLMSINFFIGQAPADGRFQRRSLAIKAKFGNTTSKRNTLKRGPNGTYFR